MNLPTNLLKRAPIVIADDTSGQTLDKILAQEALETLGYGCLQQAINSKTRPLGCTLNNLAIEVLDPESVKAYEETLLKQKQEEHNNALGPSIRSLAKHRYYFVALVILSILLMVLGSSVVCILGIGNKSAMTTMLGSVSFFMGFVLIILLGVADGILMTRTRHEWQRKILNHTYTKEIQPFALQKAVEIKKALPAARIFVEECEEIKDPFLVAVLGQEEYYFAVYDESKFEANLL